MSANSPDEIRFTAQLALALENPVVAQLARKLQQHVPIDAPIREGSKLAAVLVLVRMAGANDNSAELLFIQRAHVERDPWSGHIAFPGGRHDITDESLAKTALRETREEVAVDVERYGKVLGRLDDLAPRARALPPIVVRPFVAVVPADIPFEANHEVADVFWVPVKLLRSAQTQGEHAVLVNGETARFPAYNFGERVVWGLTERIVTQLLTLFD